FTNLPTYPFSNLFLSPLHHELVRVLAVPRLVALGRHAPRRHGVSSAGGLAFAAAQRVIDRVHRDAAHMRALAHPAAAAGLADRHVLVIDVADLADRREALHVDLADFARRHLDRGVVAFLRHQLHGRTSAPRNLAASS